MSNPVKNSNKFMLMTGDPYGPARENTPKNRRKEALAKMKLPKSTDITQMSTSHIIWYIAYKHRVGLLIMALVISWTLFVVRQAPASINNLVN